MIPSGICTYFTCEKPAVRWFVILPRVRHGVRGRVHVIPPALSPRCESHMPPVGPCEEISREEVLVLEVLHS